MSESQKNIETEIKLAHHLGDKVECIKICMMELTPDGAALYEVVCESGERRYVIEGETGTLMEPIEDDEEAMRLWKMF